MSEKDFYNNSDEINKNADADSIKTNSEENDFDYDKSNSDSEKNGQDILEDVSDQEKTDECEGKDISAKCQDAQEQEGPSGEGCEDGKTGSDGSSADEVTSTEYVWNPRSRDASDGEYHYSAERLKEHTASDNTYSSYTSYYSGSSPQDPGPFNGVPKKKKGIKITLIAVACVLALALLGGASYYAVTKFIASFSLNSDGEEQIDISKNNGPIKVQLNTNSDGSVAMSKADVIEKVAASVVEIEIDDGSAGSGVIVALSNEYAYIVTNEHVVDGATSITVTLNDTSQYEARYLDGDALMDIAMLCITKDKAMTVADLGSSTSLRVGDEVVAIGNAFGVLGGTATSGIISGLNRETTINTLALLQTDAAVNPGNSGGGLFNMAGELVGIVNAKTVTTESDNTGYAIPIDSIVNYIIEIIEDGYIHGRPTINIEAEYVSDPMDAIRKYGTSTTGVFVMSSTNSQIKAGDYIDSINGIEVTDSVSYTAAVSSLKIGETVKVVLYRDGSGQYWNKHTINVTVEEYVPSGMFG